MVLESIAEPQTAPIMRRRDNQRGETGVAGPRPYSRPHSLHDQNRGVTVGHHFRCLAAEDQALYSTSTVRRHDDQVAIASRRVARCDGGEGAAEYVADP